MKQFHILVVDDEAEFREALQELLSREGYNVQQASGGKEALNMLSQSSIDLIITDMFMPEMKGIELLKKVKESHEEIPVLMITGHTKIEDAVEAIKLGAEDYLAKPFDKVELFTIVKRLHENRIFKNKSEILKQEVLRKTIPSVVGESREIRRVLKEVQSVAPSDASVLIQGESGTGKELVAKAIHTLSNRKQEPFIAINAAAVPKDLLESEFFGYEKGAFSGATDRKYGLFEIANEGSLFLDEIAEMPLDLQSKLLRTVETKKLRRLGGTQEISVDFRIISATNRNLKQEIKEKRFREDLYFRLSTFCINVPPLRERKEDIALIAIHFLKNRNYQHLALEPDVVKALQLYEWPGNVRELENAMERAVLLSGNQPLRLKVFPAEIQELYKRRSRPESISHATLEEIEKEHILKVYEACGSDKVSTAKTLGIGLKTLYRKLKQYGI
jgi:DNA-binding NtrC family response regulator